MKLTAAKTALLASLSAIMVIGVYILVVGNDSNTTNSTSNNSTSTVTKVSFRDGSYEASVDYQVPRGTNNMKAVVTIKDGIVTAVTTENTVASEKSKEYTTPFEQQISDVVVGKKLSDAKISKIAGASGTSKAYNDIIDQVIEKAEI